MPSTFSKQPIRDGLRQLFDEFEEFIAGRYVTVRGSQRRSVIIPWSEVKAAVAGGQVSVSFRQAGDLVADYRLNGTQTTGLLVQLIRAIEEIDPGATE